MNDNEKFLNDNSMEAIDKKINEVATDNLNGLNILHQLRIERTYENTNKTNKRKIS